MFTHRNQALVGGAGAFEGVVFGARPRGNLQQPEDTKQNAAMRATRQQAFDTAWICAALVLLAGCASSGFLARRTPVPASNIYCLSTSTDAGFRSNLLDSTATYGARNLRWIGNGSICDLIHFEKYVVSWQTKDGRSERFEFDFEKIMRKFQDETPRVHTLTRLNGQPDLFLAFQSNRIEIYYLVSQYREGGMEMRNGLPILTQPAVVTRFPLLTVLLAAAVPASAGK